MNDPLYVDSEPWPDAPDITGGAMGYLAAYVLVAAMFALPVFAVAILLVRRLIR